MKLLKIENNQGYYLVEDKKYAPLDQIAKDDLLILIDLALEDDAVFDEFSEEKIKNQAHQIIYKSIYGKLKGLRKRKDEFRDESERLYLSEYERYRTESS